MSVRLTDTFLRRLTPPPGRLDIRDAVVKGLVLRVGASGTRTWGVWYRVNGHAARYTLGPYRSEDSASDGLTLAQARAQAREIINAARVGRDLQAEKIEVRQADSLADLAIDFLADGRSLRKKTPWRTKTRVEFERLLKVEIVPTLGGKRPDSVTKADVIALVDRIAKRAPTTANRALSVLKLLYTWGRKHDRIQIEPAWPDAPSPEVRRERVLRGDELRAVWAALEAEPSLLATALKLMLLTAQRRGEVLGLRWCDVAEEPDGWWWTIPAEANKSGRAHRVPLTRESLALLDGMRRVTGARPWVFPSPRAANGPIANPQKAAERLWKRAGVDGARVHDFRRTAASHMAAAKVPRMVIRKLLNHSDGEVTAIYDRHSYDAEKRAALETWAQRLVSIVSSAATTARFAG